MNTTMSRSRFGALQIAIVLLTVATAAIHLFLAFSTTPPMTLFILNGVGYLALVAALYLPQLSRYHKWIRWALIVFTAITVIAWIAIGQRMAIAYVDKIIEVALIVLLFIEGRR